MASYFLQADSPKRKPPSVGAPFRSRCVADTSSPLGSAIFTIISAVAQLERDIIAERVKAGLRRAKENGKKLGRPRVAVDVTRIAVLRAQGHSWARISKELGIGTRGRHRGPSTACPKTLPKSLM